MKRVRQSLALHPAPSKCLLNVACVLLHQDGYMSLGQ